MKKTIKIGDKEFEEIISGKDLAEKVEEIAKKIAENYSPTDEPPILLIVATGAMYLGTDLSRALQSQGLDHMVDIVRLKRYKQDDTSHEIKIISEPCLDFKDRNVIVVEDIIDEGLTIQFLDNYLKNKDARSIEYCVLLIKKDHCSLGFDIKYSMLNDLPPDWVAGYGMDSKQLGRGYSGIYRKI